MTTPALHPFSWPARLAGIVLTLALAVTSAPPVTVHASASQFYVSPTGRADGDGSRDRPWSLQSALAHPAAVKPGDTIWLDGGLYRGAFTSRLTGAAGAPVLLRQAPGARAILDGAGSAQATLTILGQWATYWGFEVTNSDTRRKTTTAGPWPGDLSRGTAHGIIVKGPRTTLVNVIVHDAGVGIGFWAEAVDAEIYGSIVFFNGWDGPDRGHGHGIYTQNQTGAKRIADNIIFQQFGSGLIAYGSDRAFLNNITIEGNVLFNNGGLSTVSGYARNLLLGGGTVAEGPVIIDNYTYFSPALRPGIEAVALYAGARDVLIRGNYFVHGTTPQFIRGRSLQLGLVQGLEMVDNVFQGTVQGFHPGQYPENEYYTAIRPARGTRVFVRPNLYEPGRAHVIVYNFDLASSVAVDLSAVLQTGDGYAILDAQNVFGSPVIEGVFDGRPVRLPLTRTEMGSPIGRIDSPLLKHTGPAFGVFVVVRRDIARTSRS